MIEWLLVEPQCQSVTLDWKFVCIVSTSEYSCLAEFKVHRQSYKEKTRAKLFGKTGEFDKTFRKSGDLQIATKSV